MEESMKLNYLTQKRVCIVLTFALTITGGAAYAAEEPAKNYVAVQEQNPASVTIKADSVTMPELTAGVTDLLYDNDVIDVTHTDAAAVGQALSEESEAICGYENLGIAVVDGNLNIRKKATTDSKVVGKLTNHDACEILDTKGDWYKIESGKVTGYVKSEYLVTGEEALNIAKEEIITVATVTAETLRVRKSASTDSAVISLIGEGEDLTVEDEQDGWYKVEVDDQKGYIFGDYVELSEKLPTATSVTELSNGQGVSDTRVSLVQYALQFVGNRYVWGGTSLTNGVDCSGFTMQIYAHYGISLPHHAASQPGYGRRISSSDAKPGDLFFYGSGNSITHVGIYIGNGQIVHASSPRTGIKISNAYYQTPICVVSYLN
jgi:uncharacterized protein YgiM (DUF1202 family)